MKEYLEKLKIELAMEGYHDGWKLKWIKDKIKIYTSQGTTQGIFLLLMPWILGLILFIVAPEYIEPLTNTRLGLIFINFGILLEVLGALWIKKIVMIKV